MLFSAENFTTQSLIFTIIIRSEWIIKFCIKYEHLLILFGLHSLLHNLIQFMRWLDVITLLSHIMKFWFLLCNHSNWDQYYYPKISFHIFIQTQLDTFHIQDRDKTENSETSAHQLYSLYTLRGLSLLIFCGQTPVLHTRITQEPLLLSIIQYDLQDC